MPETTFERVRKTAVETSEKELDPNSITPNSTLGELGLIEYIFGPIPFFVDLEKEFQKDHPDFEFPDNEVGDEEDDEQVILQQIVDVIDKELEKLATVSQR